jgi:hypothetical protein
VTSDRELLPKTQRVQGHCHESLQNRLELRCHDLSRYHRHQNTMNINRPVSWQVSGGFGFLPLQQQEVA